MSNGLANRRIITLENERKLLLPTFFMGGVQFLGKDMMEVNMRVDRVLDSSYRFICNGSEKVRKPKSDWTIDKFVKMEKDSIFFLDSGGFSFKRRPNIHVSAHNIVDLYKIIKPDLGAVLDHPFAYDNGMRWENYKRWQTTLKNTHITFSRRKEIKDVSIVVVLHGYCLNDVKRSIRTLQKLFDKMNVSDGFKYIALGIKSFSAKLGMLGSFSEQLVRNILCVRKTFPDSFFHVFGAGSTDTLLNLYYMGVDSVDYVAWRVSAAHGGVYLGMFDKILANSEKHKPTNRELEMLANCECPVCSSFDNVDDILQYYDYHGQNATHQRYIHNYFTLQKRTDFIFDLIKQNKLREYMEKHLSETYNGNLTMWGNIKRYTDRTIESVYNDK